MRVIRVRKGFWQTGWGQERHAVGLQRSYRRQGGGYRRHRKGYKEQRAIRAWGQVGAGSSRGQGDMKGDRDDMVEVRVRVLHEEFAGAKGRC